MAAIGVLLSGCFLAFIARVDAYKLTAASRFTQWFQQFADNMYPALHDHCWGNYTLYTTKKESNLHPESIASDLVSCLLDAPALSEAIKANMASAQVLLGFLPTILTTVGCNTAETSLVGLRRPLLALLVTFGSPAPSPIRSFEFYDPIEMLENHEKDVHGPPMFRDNKQNVHGPLRKSLALTVQLLLVLAAVANTAELALELGYLTVSTWAPSRPWLVILWTLLGVLVHIFGSITLRLRVRVIKGEAGDQSSSSDSFLQGFRDEFSLCSTHTPTKLHWKKESRWFVFLSWFTSNGAAVIVVYGTLVFSSLMFISTQDATIVVLRYLVSALICRAVLMSELNGMRSVSKVQGKDKEGTEMQPLAAAEEIVPSKGV